VAPGAHFLNERLRHKSLPKEHLQHRRRGHALGLLPRARFSASTKFVSFRGLEPMAATAADIRKRIHAAAMTALRSPAVIEQFARVSGVASPGTPQDYAAFLAAEQARWSKIVAAIGFKE